MLRLFAFIKDWVQRKQTKSFKQPQEQKVEVEFETAQPPAHEAAAPKLASKSKLYYINRYTLDLEEAIVDEVFDGGFSVFFIGVAGGVTSNLTMMHSIRDYLKLNVMRGMRGNSKILVKRAIPQK